MEPTEENVRAEIDFLRAAAKEDFIEAGVLLDELYAEEEPSEDSVAVLERVHHLNNRAQTMIVEAHTLEEEING